MDVMTRRKDEGRLKVSTTYLAQLAEGAISLPSNHTQVYCLESGEVGQASLL